MKSLRTLLAAALVAGFATVPGAATATEPVKPPVVLVHGAWMDASVWDQVAANLRREGFAVTAVNLPGHGADATPAEKLSLAGYVDAVDAALPATGQAVLVGHSMAGMVISGVAEKSPQKLKRLVYVAAYLPRDGESLYQLSQTDAGSLVPRYWMQENPKAYSPAWIRKQGIVDVFCADCGDADKQRLVAQNKPEALGPLATPVKLSAARFGSVPKTYVYTTQDQAVSYGLQRSMVENAGGGVATQALETSHAAMLSRPEALARLIAESTR